MDNSSKLENDEKWMRKCLIWSKRTLLERYLILVCILITFAFFTMIGLVLYLETARIMSNMDVSIDPCNDFYQFSCGSFIKYQNVPDNKEGRSFLGDLNEYTIKLARDLLQEPVHDYQPEFAAKIKTLYKSCLNKPSDSYQALTELLNRTELKSWPILEHSKDSPTVEEISTIMIIYNLHPLFNLRKKPSNLLQEIRLESWKHTLLKPSVFVNDTEEYVKDKETYTRIIINLLLKLKIPLENVSVITREILDVDEDFVKFSEKYEDYNATSVNSTLKELDSLCLQLKWTKILKYILSSFGHEDEYDEEMIIVLMNPDYIKVTCDMISKIQVRKFQNYLIWNFIANFLIHYDSNFAGEFIQIKHTSRVIKFTSFKSWKSCVKSIINGEMHIAVSYLFIESLKTTKSVEEILYYIEEIANSTERMFSTETWLEDEDKFIGKRKIMKMEWDVGYDDIYKNAETIDLYFKNINFSDSYVENILFLEKLAFARNFFNESVWNNILNEIGIKPVTVNAFYNGRVVLPLAILQAPIFIPEAPKYLNFGSIGVIIGHEISHEFDNLDLQLQSQDNSSKSNLWSKSALRKFQDRALCIINQYSEFPLDDDNGIMVSGNKTIRENIADISGINLAFSAYESYLKKHGEEPKLLGLDFNNKQMFFLRYAQLSCEVLESTKIYERDSHSPKRYRVLGPLRNSPQFSETFKCPEDSPMNPLNKCKIWG
ncbi:neprilysin-like isoform X2 [Centruroides vittatus]|uniref:neprilysin-like isoform X2 n=1 Tax=Centruroides vittatus TaxID=120091 RepID=UPI00350EED56